MILAMLVWNGDAMLMRSLHRHLFGHFVTSRDGHVFTYGFVHRFEYLSAVSFRYFVTFGNGHMLWRFHRDFVAHFVADDLTYGTMAMVSVTIVRIGFGIGIG